MVRAGTEREIEAAFDVLAAKRIGALVVSANPFFNSHRELLVALATRHAMPAIFEWREFTVTGGLMSYGPDLINNWRRAAIYVDKILKGTKPAELPIEQPKKFEFAVNLTTAKQIGLTIPPNVLARADKVIK